MQCRDNTYNLEHLDVTQDIHKSKSNRDLAPKELQEFRLISLYLACYSSHLSPVPPFLPSVEWMQYPTGVEKHRWHLFSTLRHSDERHYTTARC